MNHNYKLEDFKNVVTETEDTDIKERIVSVNLCSVRELPIIIMQKLEKMINKMIADHEHEYDTVIPIENMELGIYMSIDTKENNLFLSAFIGYGMELNEEIYAKEIITAMDADYHIIKKYFFNELSHYLFEQIKRITKCV